MKEFRLKGMFVNRQKKNNKGKLLMKCAVQSIKSLKIYQKQKNGKNRLEKHFKNCLQNYFINNSNEIFN